MAGMVMINQAKAPTKLMKETGYGAGYAYDHDQPDAFSGQNYFPEEMGRKRYYDPPERGFEREIRKLFLLGLEFHDTVCRLFLEHVATRHL